MRARSIGRGRQPPTPDFGSSSEGCKALPLPASQRLESVVAVGHAIGQRQQVDIQAGGPRRHERQQCVRQLTLMLVLRDLGLRTTGPHWLGGLESTRWEHSKPLALSSAMWRSADAALGADSTRPRRQSLRSACEIAQVRRSRGARFRELGVLARLPQSPWPDHLARMRVLLESYADDNIPLVMPPECRRRSKAMLNKVNRTRQ